jgi:hypothetical protein
LQQQLKNQQILKESSTFIKQHQNATAIFALITTIKPVLEFYILLLITTMYSPASLLKEHVILYVPATISPKLLIPELLNNIGCGQVQLEIGLENFIKNSPLLFVKQRLSLLSVAA